MAVSVSSLGRAGSWLAVQVGLIISGLALSELDVSRPASFETAADDSIVVLSDKFMLLVLALERTKMNVLW